LSDYLIVSYGTVGTLYEACLAKQEAAFAETGYLGLKYPDAGKWGANTKLKPIAIRKALERSKNVLWIDADTLIDPPEEFPKGRWDVGLIDNKHPRHKAKICACYILFRNTEGAHKFLNEWDRQMIGKDRDHGSLIRTINRMNDKVAIKNVSKWLEGRQHFNALIPGRGEYRA